ncbi:endolytic transglycosylase MltG [Shewanella maritima]|uniref:endolytic transglycosylase MltG n=1 Tax=Shewanella maritima TaxID=2520507 RepID=UPI003735EF49
MNKTLTRIIAVVSTAITLCLIAGYFFTQSVLQFPQQTLLVDKTEQLTVEPGMNVTRLVNQLQQQNWITDAWKIKYLVKLEPKWTAIRTGLYQINPGDSLAQLLTRIKQGQQVTFSVTLIEGRTIKEWQQTLQNAAHLQFEPNAFEKVLTLNGDDSGLPEGKFYPDTFQYHAGDKLVDVLSRSYNMMQTQLSKAWEGRDKDLRLQTPYELLIIASIIEKETGKADERDWVAAVFNNRLKLGMRLQTDPTVIYGMGERYQGNITRKDLLEHTPFNTYRINGLPPTPIAAPSGASLYAAANPAEVDYLYFVSRNDGSHVFSTNLRDHNNAVNKYQRNR